MRTMNLLSVAWLLLLPACSAGVEETSDEAGSEGALRGAEALSPEERAMIDANDSAPVHGETANLVASIEIEPGHQVEFYEPEPGLVWISQAGLEAQTPIDLTDHESVENGLELYQRLAGRAAPAELREAYQRAERRAITLASEQSLELPAPAAEGAQLGGGSELSPFPELRPRNGNAEGAAQLSEALTGSEFAASSFKVSGVKLGFCPSGRLSGHPYVWCLLDWWNGAFASSGATDETWATLYADIGDVLMKVSTGRGGGKWTVYQGSWRAWYSGYSFCGFSHYCDFSARYDVLEAENNRFHFGGVFLHWD